MKVNAERDLFQLFEALDEKSRAILWHLWWHRHAEIAELRDLVDVASDCEVIARLKEVINGKARELWGEPVVSFEESKYDPLTGEKVPFSWWWLDGKDVPATSRDKLFVDVLDEKSTVTIIAQLPGWDSAASTNTDKRKGAPEVRVEHVKYKNGLLQISLEKGRR